MCNGTVKKIVEYSIIFFIEEPICSPQEGKLPLQDVDVIFPGPQQEGD
jgi:hypothetical protein